MADSLSAMLGSAGLKLPELQTPDQYKKEVTDVRQKEQAAVAPLMEQEGKNLSRQRQIAMERIALPLPSDPNIQTPPPAPKPEMRDPVQSLGGLLSVIALLGSFKTRAPATAAFNAAAASMNAFHQGDMERVKLEREKWRDKLDETLKANDAEIQKYNAALKKYNYNFEKARPELEVIAAENDHMAHLVQLQQHDAQGSIATINGMQKANEALWTKIMKHDESMQREKDRAERAAQAAQAHADSQKMIVTGPDGKPYTIDKRTLPAMQPDTAGATKFGATPSSNAAVSDMSDPANAKFWADKYLADKSIPAFAWGSSGNKDRQLWREAIVREGKARGMSGTESAANQAIFKSNQMSLSALTKDLNMLEPYKNMLDINGDVAVNLAKKAIHTNSALANKPLNWLQQHAGDYPDTAEFLFQANILRTEAARVLNNPRLVGQLTDEAKRDLDAVTNGNMPLNAFERVVGRMKADGTYRIEQLRNQVNSIKQELHTDIKPPSGEGQDRRATDMVPDGIPVGSKVIGKTPDGKDVYQSPDGKKWTP